MTATDGSVLAECEEEAWLLLFSSQPSNEEPLFIVAKGADADSETGTLRALCSSNTMVVINTYVLT